MSLRSAFTICFTTLTMASVLALAAAEETMGYVLLVALVLVLRLVMYRGGKTAYLSRWTSSALVCIAFLFAGIDFNVLSQQVMLCAAHFLVAVQTIRFFEEKGAGEYAWMVLLAVVQLAVAAIVSLEFALAVPMLVVAMAIPPVLIMLTIMRGIEDTSPKPIEGDILMHPMTAEIQVGGRLFVSSLVAGLVCIGVATVIFVSVPRLRAELFAQETMADPVPVTGFDTEVDLDDIGNIKQNSAEVMKVKILVGGQPIRPEGIEPYWRGITLDTYDDFHRWWSSQKLGGVHPVHGQWMGLTALYPQELKKILKRSSGLQLKQEYTLQPVDTKALFGLNYMTHVSSRHFKAVDFHHSGQTIRLLHGRTNTVKYTVQSTVFPLTPQLEQQLRAASGPLPSKVRRSCLRLPGTITPRVRALAADLAPPGRYPTQYDRVRAIEAFFLDPGNFTYTLNVGAIEDREPTDAFLFERKTGHCSFFASAMVVLLRSIQIPARMVNGFYGGEWNDFGDFFLIRQADAHSWLEVYFPGHGWVTFDPTPAGNRVRSPESGVLAAISRYIEYLDTLWLAHVVGYTADSSKEVALGLMWKFRRLADAWDADFKPPEIEETPPQPLGLPSTAFYLVVGAIVVAIVVAATMARIYGIPLLTRLARSRPEKASIAFYRKFLDIMRRKGYPKPASMTPMEFLRTLQRGPSAGQQPATFVTERFCAARYGGIRTSREDRAAISAALSVLTAMPRQHQSDSRNIKDTHDDHLAPANAQAGSVQEFDARHADV